MFRLFIDETGHDHLKSSNSPNEQYLCLMGIILSGGGHWELTQRMDAIKLATFGTRDVVLHRRELIDKNPPFDVLRNPTIRAGFDASLIEMIRDCRYVALSVLIDKQALLAKHRVWHYHPYHYCLAVMLERYVLWLKEHNGKGDVLAEWRGKKPNMRLERSFNRLYQKGTSFVSAAEMRGSLTSAQLKFEKKEANTAGLQLADLVAHPTKTHWVCELRQEKMKAQFGQEVVKILINQKFRRSPEGIIDGIGVKILP